MNRDILKLVQAIDVFLGAQRQEGYLGCLRCIFILQIWKLGIVEKNNGLKVLDPNACGSL